MRGRAKDVAAPGGRLGPGEIAGLFPFIPWSWNGTDPLLHSNPENIATPKAALILPCIVPVYLQSGVYILGNDFSGSRSTSASMALFRAISLAPCCIAIALKEKKIGV